MIRPVYTLVSGAALDRSLYRTAKTLYVFGSSLRTANDSRGDNILLMAIRGFKRNASGSVVVLDKDYVFGFACTYNYFIFLSLWITRHDAERLADKDDTALAGRFRAPDLELHRSDRTLSSPLF